VTRVAVVFEWQAAGEVMLDAARPRFTDLPSVPGLYRLTFEGHDVSRVYIGETDNLRRRAQRYRTPGAAQPTNVRMNKELVEALAAGGRVSCATVTEAGISLDVGEAKPLDLSRKTSRLIVENAAMAAVIAAREADPDGGPVLMNRPGVGEVEWA
jgi:hypothetical protein